MCLFNFSFSKANYLFAFALLFSYFSFSQNFIPVDEKNIQTNATRHIVPDVFTTYQINLLSIKNSLNQAPHENTVSVENSNHFISLPDDQGNLLSYRVVESPIMESGLQAKYPNIRTYKIAQVENSAISGRLDISPYGLHFMIAGADGDMYLDPYSQHNTDFVMVYLKQHLQNPHNFHCHQEGDQANGNSNQNTPSVPQVPNNINNPLPGISPNGLVAAQPAPSMIPHTVLTNGSFLRSYRLALATTGEYTAFHGGTVAQALAAMTTTMNRVNEIYERDVAVRLVMINNTDTLIEVNGASDPYTNGNTGVMINESQTQINAIIGAANYDIGHLFGTNSGGLAGLGVVCLNSQKARGVTGSGAPTGDPFDIDYVAHEMGHQFGASHTYNNSCNGNRTASSAYEPGSGSTIMAYAGICPPNLQSNSDSHFHLKSLDQINNLIVNSAGCFTQAIPNSNTAPTISVPQGGFRIPISTPFELTATSTDVDGDSLTYCWEEYDLGPVTTTLNTPSGTEPIFRSWPVTNNPTRVFPRITDLINNTTAIGELLPTYDRQLKFRVTVRDNNQSGGSSFHEVVFLAHAAAGPFVVNVPNGGESIAENSTSTVTWNVANTDMAPVSASHVDIFLSTDGGLTYPITLATNEVNDGTADVYFPTNIIPTGFTQITSCRIKVKASQNIFFDISNANFTITPPTADDFLLNEIANGIDICGTDTGKFELGVTKVLNFEDTVTLSTTGVPTGVIINFDTNLVVPDDTISVDIIPNGITPGQYNFMVHGVSNGLNDSAQINFNISDTLPNALDSLMFPAHQATNVTLGVNHTWSAGTNNWGYHIQVATDSLFTNIVREDSTNTNSWAVNPPYDQSTIYFWRVASYNSCGHTEWVDTFKFETDVLNVIPGCTDTAALNYNPSANTDDGSCIPKVFGCTNPNATNYNASANIDDGSCVIEGCTNPAATNYNPDATVDNGSCIILGCTDSTALNYNPDATLDNGSCIPKVFGCMDTTAFNYNPTANVDNGTCIIPTFGCKDPQATNYDSTVLVHQASFCYYSSGCTDSSYTNYDPFATVDNGTCAMDSVYFNMSMVQDSVFNFYITTAPGLEVDYVIWNLGDGSPIDTADNAIQHYYTSDGSYVINAQIYTTSNNSWLYHIDTVIQVDIRGCTNPQSLNFSVTAVIDDNSCTPHIFGCNNPDATNYNPNVTVNNGSCIIPGCTDSTAINYNADATTDNGSCIASVPGCIDSTAFNYNANANTDDGSCIPFIYGCLDSNAFNYNPSANSDTANSCIPKVFGCTDTNALNYDANANTDNGTCSYDPSTSTLWDVIITSENHTILVPDTADINLAGQALSAGDVIGVFYMNGNALKCGGKITWNNSSATIAAYGNDAPTDNGFQNNETFIWKIYKASNQTTYDVTVNYNTNMPNSDQYIDNGISAVAKISSDGLQQISLNNGWNLVSTNIDPENDSLNNTLQSILSNIELVKDENGQVFWPVYNIDNIDTLTIGKAYKIRANQNIIWSLSGAQIDPTEHILELPQGWSYLGYLRKNGANISNALSSINNNIFIVKNSQGDVYWPQFSINNIGNMNPGEGYQINMSSIDTLIYAANNVTLPMLKMAQPLQPKKYLIKKKSSENMHLGILLDHFKFDISTGDEIAVFNQNDELVGAAVYENKNMAISVFQYEDQPNVSLYLKHFSLKKNLSETLLINGANQKAFNIDDVESVVLSKKKVVTETDHFEEVLLDQTNNTIIFKPIDENQSKTVEIEIFNSLGQQLAYKQLILKAQSEIDLSDELLSEGVFFIHIKMDQKTIVKKIRN
ncbi:MAG: M12 family metallo-peptidase [Flavobacteriales bacterium]|jgi:hypothetical protein|nr:M12 family metallo-peptidase [Flavobacteriales bacterium]